jgi:hypothetical protein
MQERCVAPRRSGEQGRGIVIVLSMGIHGNMTTPSAGRHSSVSGRRHGLVISHMTRRRPCDRAWNYLKLKPLSKPPKSTHCAARRGTRKRNDDDAAGWVYRRAFPNCGTAPSHRLPHAGKGESRRRRGRLCRSLDVGLRTAVHSHVSTKIQYERMSCF